MTILKLHIHRHNMSRGPPTQKTSLIENSIFKVFKQNSKCRVGGSRDLLWW